MEVTPMLARLQMQSIVKDCLGLSLPEKDSRKMGTLILYSEPSWKKEGRQMGLQGYWHRRKLQLELHTLQDLTRTTLA